MVNLHQLGKAAFVAAFVALENGILIKAMRGEAVTKKLREGGSAL